MGSKWNASVKKELAYMPLECWRARKGGESRAAPRALQCKGGELVVADEDCKLFYSGYKKLIRSREEGRVSQR